jgi:uncharacterized protein YjiS (DUF1127 family)
MNTNVIDHALHPVASMIAEMRPHAWLSFKANRSFRAAKAELMTLNNLTLKDIGLDRSEIESVITDRNRERRNGASRRFAV